MAQYKVSMPSNIALIKYMGKTNSGNNLPTNASLSYTLNHLQTTVTLTKTDLNYDSWDEATHLDEPEKQRFLKHLQFLKKTFACRDHFQIHSENNFPSNCGLASSASSFAALTACAAKACGATAENKEIAMLSRHGSGSSCRSFFSPWALWEKDNISAPELPYVNLMHSVIVVSRARKSISSSAAHQRVTSSLLFESRVRRAQTRLSDLSAALLNHDWEKAYIICWQEFWDMHALFETCAEPFGYLLPESLAALAYLRNYWQQYKDGPLVTMDAGPNIHLLFRRDQIKSMETIKQFFADKVL